jgi:protein-tyrosine phosphatase
MKLREDPQHLALPFSRSYWVREGTFIAGYYPGSFNQEEEQKKLELLLDCGVQTVVNLMEDGEFGIIGDESRYYYASLQALDGQRGLGVETLRFPIEDMSVPDIETMTCILDAIDQAIRSGRRVYLHCLGGLGRTGTVVGCWLARHGIATGEGALAAIHELRVTDDYRDVPSPQTWEQREFVRNWEAGR